MASLGEKKENLRILEEIYHEDKSKKTPKKSFSLRNYLQQGKRIEQLLSGAIIVFCLAAIWLGFFQFNHQIQKNFLARISGTAEEEAQQPDLLGQKTKDTDSDGLSDYDELNVYYTSPYLPDTDSDGLTDREEIERSSDPNCPEGQNCFADWTKPTDASSPASQANPADSIFTGQTQVSQLRELLRQAGMSESDLAKFSDQQLLETYQEALKQTNQASQPAQTGEAANPAATTIELPTNQPEDLTPAQVRQLLLNAGIPQNVLDQTTDEELTNLIKETLNEQQR